VLYPFFNMPPQGLDLLQSPKDHSEFTLVREWIKQQLSPLCTGLAVEVQKSVLKQATVQHLYGRLAGLLKRGVGDAALLASLHPTPAVCGRPREAALEYLQQHEPFDRGFYAGPFGWVTGQGAEFAVAIRSAMLPVTPAPQAAAAAAAAAAPTAAAAGAATAEASSVQQVKDFNS
jgi:isochorismate synthase EntC